MSNVKAFPNFRIQLTMFGSQFPAEASPMSSVNLGFARSAGETQAESNRPEADDEPLENELWDLYVRSVLLGRGERHVARNVARSTSS